MIDYYDYCYSVCVCVCRLNAIVIVTFISSYSIRFSLSQLKIIRFSVGDRIKEEREREKERAKL